MAGDRGGDHKEPDKKLLRNSCRKNIQWKEIKW